MSIKSISMLSAAVLLSGVAFASVAQAGEATPVVQSQAIATHGSGDSNRPGGQPPSAMTGDGHAAGTGPAMGTVTGDRTMAPRMRHHRHHMMHHMMHHRHHHMMRHRHHHMTMGGGTGNTHPMHEGPQGAPGGTMPPGSGGRPH